MLHKLALLSITLLFFSCANADEDQPEQILNFNSNITVNQDASIDITENISVYAKQQAIKHGITRWLPTSYIDDSGHYRYPHYQIRVVEVNNQPSPFHINQKNNKLIIYIGKSSWLLSPGIYNYTIQYHVNNAINFLDNEDELYWNITGNFWDFPILQAEATITLPQSAAISHFAGYTGRLGEKGNDFRTSQLTANQISFTTINSLDPGMGLTIGIAWPKGFIQKESLVNQLIDPLFTDPAARITLEITLILLGYYLLAWYLVGRDPEQGTIIPLFEPPMNLSPAAMRFIVQMEYDIKAFTATIIDLAARGFLNILDSGSIMLTKNNIDTKSLSTTEKNVFTSLFKDSGSLLLDHSNFQAIQSTNKILHNGLRSEFENIYFISNLSYLIPGFLLSLLALAVVIFSSPNSSDAFPAATSLLMISWVGYISLTRFLFNLKQIYLNFSIAEIFPLLFSGFFAIVLTICILFLIYFFADFIPWITIGSILLIVILNILFYHLLKAPTMQGRKVMDQIAGFKQFLSVTERYRLEQLHPPQKTPALFEKYLSYAIALDVENQWGEQFNDLIKDQDYHPSWYAGPGFQTGTITGFSSYISAAMLGSLSSATTSSGSGGGGSSGGGGGGGGGGGW